MKPMYIRDDRIMPKNNKYARVVTFFHLLHLRHRPNVHTGLFSSRPFYDTFVNAEIYCTVAFSNNLTVPHGLMK